MVSGERRDRELLQKPQMRDDLRESNVSASQAEPEIFGYIEIWNNTGLRKALNGMAIVRFRNLNKKRLTFCAVLAGKSGGSENLYSAGK